MLDSLPFMEFFLIIIYILSITFCFNINFSISDLCTICNTHKNIHQQFYNNKYEYFIFLFSHITIEIK